MNMNFYMPTRLVTGKGCVTEHADLFRLLGKKALLVTGKTAARKSGALADVTKALEQCGMSYVVFDGIEQNPSYDTCKEASLLALQEGADCIVGIGGGSPLDAAKAIAVLATDRQMDSDGMYGLQWNRSPLPIAAVGTTAGTGSEVTPVAVITCNGMKKSLRHDRLYPTVSFGDPTYTLSLDVGFTRSTAIDALCHCVESYFNRTANELSRCFALRGTALLLEELSKTASNQPLGYEDREKLYLASLYGGLAISVTGTAFPHAMGYFLSEQYGVPHGAACGVYLPAFLAHNALCEPELYTEFTEKLEIGNSSIGNLVKKNMPALSVSLTREQVQELLPRFDNNKSLQKCFGNVDRRYAEELLTRLFVK